jgi:small subunit ribosomal protein S1
MEPQDPIEPQPVNEFAQLLEESLSFEPLERGQIRIGTIQQIRQNEIIVDLGVKQDGIVPAQDLDRLPSEFKKELNVGQEVPVYILNPYDSDGNVIASINMGLQKHDWDKAQALLQNQEVVDVVVSGHNRGGVLVRWNRLEGFIPTSHMVTVSPGLTGNDRRDTLQDMMGAGLHVKVIEVEPNRRRLIFSEREAQKEWRVQQKARLLSELGEGQIIKGTVTGLRDFGAFVNLGGADGLIHVSELAWHRVDHPRDVLRIGQEIDVYVLSLDRETNRIALSRKRLLPDPWLSVMEKYHEGQQAEGTVTNVVDFGAFIALDDGLEGLLHLSEMGDGTLKEPHSYIKKGDRLKLCISHLEPERRRVGFTQRWGLGEEGAEDGAPGAAPAEAPLDAMTAALPSAPEEAETAAGETAVDEQPDVTAPPVASEAEAAPAEAQPEPAAPPAPKKRKPRASAAPAEEQPEEAGAPASAPEAEAPDLPAAEDVTPDDEAAPEA